MIGSKAGAAGSKRSCGQMTKRKRDPGVVAGVSGDGGSGVSVELDGVADLKFFGVRDSPNIVEVKNYVKGHNLYTTVKEGKLEAAIIHDVARVFADFSYPEEGLNIGAVVLRIQNEAQIQPSPIDRRFLVEFTEQHPLKLIDLPDEQFPLQWQGLSKEQFVVLKEEIIKLGHQCFQELKKKIYHIQGYQRKDVDMIPPYLPEDNVPPKDDRFQALKDLLAEVVAEFAPSTWKLLDAKGEADKKEWIKFLKVLLEKLESAQNLKDGDLFFNPYVPQGWGTLLQPLCASVVTKSVPT